MSTLLSIIGICLLVGLDQWTKYYAAIHLSEGPHVLWDGVLEFRLFYNQGAAFSMLQNQFLFFYIGTAIVLAALVFLWIRMPRSKHYLPLRIVFVFLAAGAIGNLIDRVMLHAVRDFIYVSWIDFPIFNVADIYVTCSAIALVLLVLLYYKEDADFDFLKIRRDK